MSGLRRIPGAPPRGLLLDIDGTLLAGERAIPGAPAAVARLRAAGLRLRLLTNTSRRSRAATASALAEAGFDLDAAEVLTPAVLARRLILDSGRRRAALLVPDEARADFEGILEDRRRPHWVVLGDLGEGFTFELLNRAFRLVRAGATLLVLHRNRFWAPPGSEEVLDVGPFAAALEFATGRPALLVGKPSPDFVRLALEEIGLAAAEAVLVGDDAEADVGAASAAGCRAVLVRTGRYRGGPEGIATPPDLVVDSIADL